MKKYLLNLSIILATAAMLTNAAYAQWDGISDGGGYDFDISDGGGYDYGTSDADYYDYDYGSSDSGSYDDLVYSYLIYSYEYPAPYDSYYYEPAPGSVFVVPHFTYDPGPGSVYIPPQYNPPTLVGSVYTPPPYNPPTLTGSVYTPPPYNPPTLVGSVYTPPASTYNPGPGSVFTAPSSTYNPGSGSVLGASISSPTITKTVRNITLNQSAFLSLTEAQPIDIVEFEIRVRNNATTGDYLTLRDILPSALEYITRTTKVNGIYVNDGVASGGLNLGFFSAGEEKIVQFRVVVVNNAAEQTVTNRAIVTSQYVSGDAYAQVTIKKRGRVLGAANILTGPEDLWLWILASSLSASSLLYWALRKYRIISWGAFLWANPEIDLEQRLREMRTRESRPDIV